MLLQPFPAGKIQLRLSTVLPSLYFPGLVVLMIGTSKDRKAYLLELVNAVDFLLLFVDSQNVLA